MPQVVRTTLSSPVRERLAGLYGGAASLECSERDGMVQLTMCRRRPVQLVTSPTAIVAEDEETLRHQLVEQLEQLWPEL